MAEKEMLTIVKLAQEWGVSEKALKQAVEKSGISPDAMKGKCRYFSRETAARIKKLLEK